MFINIELKRMLMKVLSDPCQGNFKCYIIGNWMCFIFLKTFHLSSMKLLQFWLIVGELQAFKLCVEVFL